MDKFNIKDFQTPEMEERFKLIALTVACKKVAEKNYLTLEQQMNIWIPKAWRED